LRRRDAVLGKGILRNGRWGMFFRESGAPMDGRPGMRIGGTLASERETAGVRTNPPLS